MMMFWDKVKLSFKRVKNDMEALKDSTNDWTVFLNAENEELKARVKELEKRLNKLDMKKFEDLNELF